MSLFTLAWLGEAVKVQVEDAAAAGIDEVLHRCVDDAQANHPFQNETGAAQASIQLVQEAATQSGATISGQWGSEGVRYFIFLEFGTSKMPAFPTLRPAADRHYPELAGLIKDKAAIL